MQYIEKKPNRKMKFLLFNIQEFPISSLLHYPKFIFYRMKSNYIVRIKSKVQKKVAKASADLIS